MPEEGSTCNIYFTFYAFFISANLIFVSSKLNQETTSNDSQADNIMACLLEMGYEENAISTAIEINGMQFFQGGDR